MRQPQRPSKCCAQKCASQTLITDGYAQISAFCQSKTTLQALAAGDAMHYRGPGNLDQYIGGLGENPVFPDPVFAAAFPQNSGRLFRPMSGNSDASD
jgi:hypothetical protein